METRCNGSFSMENAKNDKSRCTGKIYLFENQMFSLSGDDSCGKNGRTRRDH